MDDYRRFLDGSYGIADGWLSFYWGETPEELRDRADATASRTLDAIEAFEALKPESRP